MEPRGGGLAALRWHRALLVLFIALGLLSGLPDLFRRVSAEQANRRVELVADQQTFEQLAAAAGQPLAQVLAALRQVGVQGLGVSEDSLASLERDGLATVFSGAQWLDVTRAAGLPPPPLAVAPQGTYAIVDDVALATFVQQGLAASSGLPVQRAALPAGRTVVGIAMSMDVALDLPLGFRSAGPAGPGTFGPAAAAGFDVVPRPLGTTAPYGQAQLMALFAQIAAAGVPVHTVLFAGASTTPVPGYPDQLATTAAQLSQHGWNLGVIETPQQLGNVDQPGTRQLDVQLGQRTIRAYSVPPWMLVQYTEAQTVSAIVTSVQERNLRIVYLHPYLTGPDLVGRTVQLYADVATGLQKHGFALAIPQPFLQVTVPRWQRTLQAVGTVAAGLWLLELLFPRLRDYGYAPLAVLGLLAALLGAGSASKSQLLVPVAAASTFGGLAMCYVAALWTRLPARLGRWPGFGWLWARAAAASATMAGISFCGGVLIASLLGDTTHFLEWTYFRGIKVTYLGIPLLAVCAFAALVGFRAQERPEREGLVPQVAWAGEQPLRYKHLALMLLVAAAGAVYLLRSGNVSAAYVPGIEQHLRDYLEQHLVSRPREKEFLVGYPCLFLAVLAAARRSRWWFLLLLVGASAGQVSLVDTFEHLRTPFLLSLEREALGLVGGIATGTVTLAVVWSVLRLGGRGSGAAAGQAEGDPPWAGS